MSNPVKSVASQELADMIRNPKLRQGEDYLVVDVRDSDFAGGNIPNAINIPYHELSEDPKADLDKYPSLTKPRRVIFHCALSKSRGPNAALHFSKVLRPDQEIMVLRGGFNEWQARFKSQSDLLENFDAAKWQDDWWQS